nr:response regulator transcription factor [Archangium violaceum]
MTESATPESSPSIRVLYIEDDEFTATRTSRYLERHGLSIRWFSDGRSGLAELIREEPDIVLLDLQIPQMDGLQVCAELRRRSDVPIIIITTREEEADRVLGLEGGADDYLVKPFSTRELLARIRAHVRRARGRAGPESPVLRVGRLTIDPKTYSAALDGEPLRLTTYEFALLKALAERAGRVPWPVTRETDRRGAWRHDRARARGGHGHACDDPPSGGGLYKSTRSTHPPLTETRDVPPVLGSVAPSTLGWFATRNIT